jgi:hypothetical protein
MAERIKAFLGFMKLAPLALLQRARKIYAGMKGNPAFPKPTVPMEELAAQIETYSSLIVEASDGSRKAIAQRDAQGAVLIDMLRLLAAYVEFICGDDRETFLSSGCEPAPNTRAKKPPLSESIRNIRYGKNSGELDFRFVAVPGADSYEVQWARRSDDGTALDDWKTQPFGKTKGYITIGGLTPGTFYLFRVRALIGKVFTDWSDPVTKMSK